MEKPKKISEEVNEIMKECWNLDPQKRPALTDVGKRLNDAIHRAYSRQTQNTAGNRKTDEGLYN